MQARPNPFAVLNRDGSTRGWDWCDETGFPSGRLYSSPGDALRALLRYERERSLRVLWRKLESMLRR